MWANGNWNLSWQQLTEALRRDRKLQSLFFDKAASNEQCSQSVRHAIRLRQGAHLLTSSNFREQHGCSPEDAGLEQITLKDVGAKRERGAGF